MTAIWQIPAGPAVRSYVDVFLKHGVALIGPGDPGPWSPDCSDETFWGSYVRRFASEIELGDVLVLRTGQARIVAIGIVTGRYEHLPVFDDVNGWDLQHALRVRWGRLSEEHEFNGAPFGAIPSRCSRVRNAEVADFANRFLKSAPKSWQSAPLPALPQEDPRLEMVPEAIAGLVAQAADLLPLMQDGEGFGALPIEDEMIVHFVVPLLRAFGWQPERIAVKWRCIDVAVFRSLPRIAENCHFVIEAKRLGAGVEAALGQAKGYIAELGLECDAIVTDGIRYRLYEAACDFAPVAYANLARLKQPAADLFARMQRP